MKETIYNAITVKAPSHYSKPTRTFRTNDIIDFKPNGISFACGGCRYFIEYYKVISIEPIKEG